MEQVLRSLESGGESEISFTSLLVVVVAVVVDVVVVVCAQTFYLF